MVKSYKPSIEDNITYIQTHVSAHAHTTYVCANIFIILYQHGKYSYLTMSRGRMLKIVYDRPYNTKYKCEKGQRYGKPCYFSKR